MNKDHAASLVHPSGEQPSVEPVAGSPIPVDTYVGRVDVDWDPDAAVTPLGQLPFFIEYLKQAGLFDGWVAGCPLHYTSPNAPLKRDLLGTVLLSILSGHWRYAHITALRADRVNPPLLGMARILSEDAVRRGLAKIDAVAGETWLQENLDYVTRPLLREPWILDVDTTVKPLFSGRGWQGHSIALRLDGWRRQRRVVLLRRKLEGALAISEQDANGQQLLSFATVDARKQVWEYGALVTSTDAEILTLGQAYRDRADTENDSDELKNQWGWTGFDLLRGSNTQDRNRCQTMARSVALVFNWRNLYVRLADPDHHLQAITCRPLLLTAIGRQTQHAGRTTHHVSSQHGRHGWARQVFTRIGAFFADLRRTAERLTPLERWYRILSQALVKYLHKRQLQPPQQIQAGTNTAMG